jgi:iron complex transport system substrate-binding protein
MIMAAVMALAAVACGGGAPPALADPQRLVSLAPSVTELVFALGLGERVVGVTRYCDHPPEAATRSQVGGYLDPNYEAIVALRPDLVLLIQDQADTERRLGQLGLATLRVDHHDVAGILASIERVAAACDVVERGVELSRALEARLAAVAATVPPGPPPRVLVVVGRAAGGGSVTSVWAAGPGAFYEDVLRLAGAANACATGGVPYPELSREGIGSLDPEVIVDVQPRLAEQGLDAAAAVADWQGLVEVRAVREGRVVVLGDDFMEIPGPRVVDAVEAVAAAVHGSRR